MTSKNIIFLASILHTFTICAATDGSGWMPTSLSSMFSSRQSADTAELGIPRPESAFDGIFNPLAPTPAPESDARVNAESTADSSTIQAAPPRAPSATEDDSSVTFLSFTLPQLLSIDIAAESASDTPNAVTASSAEPASATSSSKARPWRRIAHAMGLCTSRDKCPNGHELEYHAVLEKTARGLSSNTIVFCDTCNKQPPHRPLTRNIWHCPTCNYDKCEKCGPTKSSGEGARAPTESRHQCPKGHDLQKHAVFDKAAFGYNGNPFCDVCNTKGLARNIWHCAACKYDKCNNCAQKPTHASIAPYISETLVVVKTKSTPRTTCEINIRDAPNYDGKIVGVLRAGDTIEALERTDGWVRHSRGWNITSGQMLRLSKIFENGAVVTAESDGSKVWTKHFVGQVTAVHRPAGTQPTYMYDIAFDDGSTGKRVQARHVRCAAGAQRKIRRVLPVLGHGRNDAELREGDRVYMRDDLEDSIHENGSWIMSGTPGVVLKPAKEGVLTVQWSAPKYRSEPAWNFPGASTANPILIKGSPEPATWYGFNNAKLHVGTTVYLRKDLKDSVNDDGNWIAAGTKGEVVEPLQPHKITVRWHRPASDSCRNTWNLDPTGYRARVDLDTNPVPWYGARDQELSVGDIVYLSDDLVDTFNDDGVTILACTRGRVEEPQKVGSIRVKWLSGSAQVRSQPIWDLNLSGNRTRADLDKSEPPLAFVCEGTKGHPNFNYADRAGVREGDTVYLLNDLDDTESGGDGYVLAGTSAIVQKNTAANKLAVKWTSGPQKDVLWQLNLKTLGSHKRVRTDLSTTRELVGQSMDGADVGSIFVGDTVYDATHIPNRGRVRPYEEGLRLRDTVRVIWEPQENETSTADSCAVCLEPFNADLKRAFQNCPCVKGNTAVCRGCWDQLPSQGQKHKCTSCREFVSLRRDGEGPTEEVDPKTLSLEEIR